MFFIIMLVFTNKHVGFISARTTTASVGLHLGAELEDDKGRINQSLTLE